MDIELVTDPDACMMYIVSPFAGLGGGVLWRPPAYRLFYHESWQNDICSFRDMTVALTVSFKLVSF